MGMEIVCYLLAILFSIIILLKHRNKNKLRTPLALPIIGHLHLLTPSLHRTLHALSNKYGPILFLRFGSTPTLLISSPSAAETCFTQNDAVFANRPKSIVGKHIGYNNSSLVWSPHGDHWRNLRRFAALNIFSSNNLQTVSTIRNEEIRFIFRQLFRGSEGGTRKVNLTTVFFQLTFDVMMRMVSGKRWRSGDERIFAPAGLLNMCDFFPVLKWSGVEKKLAKVQEKRDEFARGLIDECRREKLARSSSTKKTTIEEKQRKTVVETLLDLQEVEPDFYSEDIIKGIVIVMFTAGTDTTVRTLEWAMSLLLNHPEALQKARSEIEENVEEGHLVDDSDLTNLPYLRCIINETLRLFPVAPLLVPHFSSEECSIGDFKVPRETLLLVNAWAIHRNPDSWEEPEKFKPERFEGVDGEKQGFKFIPFGMGRRGCPGSGLAMRMTRLALGALIQCFDWERVGPELVDLTEGTGAFLPKVKPLEAIYTPRRSMISFLSQL